MFLLHVRAEPFAQHCYPLDLGCTNDSVFNVSTDMAESFLICSFLLSSIAVFLWSCLHTSLSFDHRVSLTWFVVVSFPGSQLQVNSTYHLDFLGLLDGCLSLYHFSNVLQVFCTWCTYAKSHQDCHCLGKCKRTTRKPRSWFQSVWGGGGGVNYVAASVNRIIAVSCPTCRRSSPSAEGDFLAKGKWLSGLIFRVMMTSGLGRHLVLS